MSLPCPSCGKIQHPSQDFCQFARGLNSYGHRDGVGEEGACAYKGVAGGIPGLMVLGILIVALGTYEATQIYTCDRTTHAHTQRSARKTAKV